MRGEEEEKAEQMEQEEEEEEEEEAKEEGLAMQNLGDAGDLVGEEWCVVRVRFGYRGWVGQEDV